VQRNQPRAQARFAELLADPAHQEVSAHATELGRSLGPYLPADVLDVELRRLGVDPSGQAAQVLLHLAGPYVGRGQWVENTATGAHTQVAAAVDAVFVREPAPSTDSLLQALTGLGIPSGIALTYLESQVALRRFGDVWVRWTDDTTANIAEAVLHVLGAPATAEAILAAIGSRASMSLATLNGTLSKDYRFIRASRRTWALRAWGITEYAGVGLRDLVEQIANHLGVVPCDALRLARCGDLQCGATGGRGQWMSGESGGIQRPLRRPVLVGGEVGRVCAGGGERPAGKAAGKDLRQHT